MRGTDPVDSSSVRMVGATLKIRSQVDAAAHGKANLSKATTTC